MEDNMKNISIDFSVFSESGVSCRIQGKIVLDSLPQIGDKIVFALSDTYQEVFTSDKYVPYVNGLFIVKHRVMFVGDEGGIVISLSDINVESYEDAQMIGKYFELSYGLIADLD